MKILYVPFPCEKAGDLSNLVNIWKDNHLKNYDSPIKIVYFNEDIGDALEDVQFEVYICAHGFDDLAFMFVGNHTDYSKADFIDIQTLADRFNHDFLYYSTQIISTHLYSCGSYQKNKSIAEQFQSKVLRTKGTINYYHGSITTADAFGKQWSLGGDKPVPVADTIRKIYIPSVSLELDEKKRESIKLIPTYEEFLEKKRNQFFSNSNANRFKRIQERRKRSSELPSITLT